MLSSARRDVTPQPLDFSHRHSFGGTTLRRSCYHRRVERRALTTIALLSLFALGCAANPTTPGDDDGGGGGGMDAGMTRVDGDVTDPPVTGPCGTSGGTCCTGRICELGLRCGAGDVCCIQPGGGQACGSATDCCRGLACEGGACCAPRNTGCSGSSDCCLGLVCSEGVCIAPEDTPGPTGCGMLGAVCCTGFTCSSGMACVEGSCESCGDAGQACCDGSSPCIGSLGCELVTDGSGTLIGTECVYVDPAGACGEIDNACCPDATGTPSSCSGDLICRGGTCLKPDDTGFEGAPCGPRGGCDPGLVCDQRMDPDGLCEPAPDDCGRDGQMCCDLGGSETTCGGSLHCQFGDCSTCRGPSLTCLLGGLLPGQQCCAGSVCRPAPLVPRCCMGEGGQCENGLDCCGLMACNDGSCSCSNQNSFCLDSSECCDGLTCQSFTCQPEGEMCKEIGVSCEGSSSECCAGLACSETRTEPSSPAVRQCCGASETSCDTNEDCCGQMLCKGGACECVGRAGLCDRDVDCCDGDVCIVGSCQAYDGCDRERQVCNPDANSCCGQLSCLRHYADETGYCCVNQGSTCREAQDCCGNMTCNPDTEKCEPVAEGDVCDTQFDCAPGRTCAEMPAGSGTRRCTAA